MSLAESHKYMHSHCSLVRLGGRDKRGYGGWTFCEMRNDSVVFSVGVGKDVTFDVAAVRRYNARVDCFDPTLGRQDFETLISPFKLTSAERARISFYPFGLAAKDDVLTFYRNPARLTMATTVQQNKASGYKGKHAFLAPVLRLQTLMTMAERRRVEVLKVDIEGSEYELFSSSARRWLAHPRRAPDQINVEFHDRIVKNARSKSDISASANATGAARLAIDVLQSCGYSQRYVHPDNSWLMIRTGPPEPSCRDG